MIAFQILRNIIVYLCIEAIFSQMRITAIFSQSLDWPLLSDQFLLYISDLKLNEWQFGVKFGI